MTVEEKCNLASDIIIKSGTQNDNDVVLSIAKCIKEDKFFQEFNEGRTVIFLTWEDDLIDGKRHIFFNNCWIEPEYRKLNSLTRLRKIFRYLFPDAHKFYWHNNKKDKMIWRR